MLCWFYCHTMFPRQIKKNKKKASLFVIIKFLFHLSWVGFVSSKPPTADKNAIIISPVLIIWTTACDMYRKFCIIAFFNGKEFLHIDTVQIYHCFNGKCSNLSISLFFSCSKWSSWGMFWAWNIVIILCVLITRPPPAGSSKVSPDPMTGHIDNRWGSLEKFKLLKIIASSIGGLFACKTHYLNSYSN